MVEDVYRERFESLVRALKPGSVLDVGCGEGAFVAAASGWAGRAAGVDVDTLRVRDARGKGLDVIESRAETLPFADGEFDVVVSQYAAHHVVDAAAATREMLRVARVGALVLDVWYDASIAAQLTMLDVERWSKRIDEDNGMVHRPVVSAAEIAGAAMDDTRYRTSVEHWLINTVWPFQEIVDFAQKQLTRSKNVERDRAEWMPLEAAGRRTGFGCEGAIVLTLLKTAGEKR